MTQIQAPDGTIVEFPDGTPDDVMAKAMRETFGGPAGPMSPAVDAGLSFASGVPRGIVETAMAPISISRMIEHGGNWLYNKGEQGVRYLAGAEPLSDEELARRSAAADASPAYRMEDRIREMMDENLHKPETRLGKFAGTIGEFAAPGSIAGKAGAVGNIAQRTVESALGNVILPAVASEGAGQLTEGTPYEGAARLAGAVGGNFAAAAGKSISAPESFLRRATTNMTPEDWDRAIADQFANKTGVLLSGPESVAQTMGGASALPNLLRTVEGSVEGRSATAPFFAQRPGQVDTAVGNVLDQIAPQSAKPSTLGPAVSEAAGNVLDKTRQGINDHTRPLYQAADAQIVPDAQFNAIKADPRFQAGLARLRGNAELAPDYAKMPDNSIAVVDAVTKDLLARGESLGNSANPLYGPELAGKSTSAAVDARNAASTASPEYAQALAEQEALRRTQLNPLEQGPVGRVAAAKDTRSAGNALLPQNPLTGSAGEAADATRRLVAEDPATTKGLVRQNLADRYTKATTETQGADTERAGSKFHKDVAGNDTRSAVLDAVLREASPQAAVSMEELLPVLQATGRRLPIGSATAFTQAGQADLGALSPAAAVFDIARSLGANLITRAGDATRRAALRGNIGRLADMFIAPDSVQQMHGAVLRGPKNTVPDAVLRSVLEGNGIMYDPAGQR
jgi:hypothetical protein